MPRNAFLHDDLIKTLQLAGLLVPRNSRMEFGPFYSQSHFIVALPTALSWPLLFPNNSSALRILPLALPPQEALHEDCQQAQAPVLIRVHLTTPYHQLLRWFLPQVMSLVQEINLVPHSQPRLHQAQRRVLGL